MDLEIPFWILDFAFWRGTGRVLARASCCRRWTRSGVTVNRVKWVGCTTRTGTRWAALSACAPTSTGPTSYPEPTCPSSRAPQSPAATSATNNRFQLFLFALISFTFKSIFIGFESAFIGFWLHFWSAPAPSISGQWRLAGQSGQGQAHQTESCHDDHLPHGEVRLCLPNINWKKLENDQMLISIIRFRCITPYPPNGEYELELRVGDVVYVHKKRDDGWYKGTLQRTGKTGLFPASFVESC